jgi:hypothetical protein
LFQTSYMYFTMNINNLQGFEYKKLRKFDQWVVWKYGTDDQQGNRPKLIFNPKDAMPASLTDSETWSSFYEAVEAYKNGKWSGIGFVLTADDPICVVKLKNCRTEQTGEIEPWTRRIVDDLNSITEQSPSLTRLQILLIAKLKEKSIVQAENIECIDRNGFIAVTGMFRNGLGFRNICERQSQIDQLQVELREKSKAETPVTMDSGNQVLNEEETPEIDNNQNSIDGLIDVDVESKELGESVEIDSQIEKSKTVQGQTIEPIGRSFDKAYFESSDRKFPKELLNPPGLVGEIAQYINEIAIKPQPEYAIAAAFVATGTIVGRKVATISDARTNVYFILVGRTASGKDVPKKGIKKIFQAAGLEVYLSADRIVSDSGILSALRAQNPCLIIQDELGIIFKSMMKASGAPHLANIPALLNELFSSADSFHSGAAYADRESNPNRMGKIYQPTLCLFGPTVPTDLAQALKSKDVASGFLPRYLYIFPEDPNPPKRKGINYTEIQIPKSIIDGMEYWHYYQPVKDRGLTDPEKETNTKKVCLPCPIETNLNPKVFPYSDAAQQLLNGFDDYCESKMNSLGDEAERDFWSRAVEHAMKIALILTAGQMKEEIEFSDMEYGIKLVSYSVRSISHYCRQFIADNRFEGEVKEILRFIKSESLKLEDGMLPHHKVTRSFQKHKSYELKERLSVLIESGQISRTQGESTGKGGRKGIFYKCIQAGRG